MWSNFTHIFEKARFLGTFPPRDGKVLKLKYRPFIPTSPHRQTVNLVKDAGRPAAG
jgi:hypothetical protein